MSECPVGRSEKGSSYNENVATGELHFLRWEKKKKKNNCVSFIELSARGDLLIRLMRSVSRIEFRTQGDRQFGELFFQALDFSELSE